jgi:hypothetical protein
MIMLLVAASNFYGATFARLGTAIMIAETLHDTFTRNPIK